MTIETEDYDNWNIVQELQQRDEGDAIVYTYLALKPGTKPPAPAYVINKRVLKEASLET